MQKCLRLAAERFAKEFLICCGNLTVFVTQSYLASVNARLKYVSSVVNQILQRRRDNRRQAVQDRWHRVSHDGKVDLSLLNSGLEYNVS